MKKNLLSGLLAGVMAVSLVACGNSEITPAADSTTETAKPATAENSDTFDVEMVGNSFSIEYCNINVDGARDAVDDLAKKGVTVNLTYNASADSSQVDEQINILNQALAKQPNAILIAACDSGALDEQMITARDAGIPVIAYDITFDNAPECSLTATSASDSILAAGQAADELLKNETVVEKIKAATPENPAVFSVIAPDAIMTVHRDRTSGFANRMYELCQEWQPGAVAITGNDAFAKDSEKDPAGLSVPILPLPEQTRTFATWPSLLFLTAVCWQSSV